MSSAESREVTEPEPWHSWMALCAFGTGVLGVASLFNSHGAAGLILLGILLLVAMIAGTVATAFWTRYERLTPGRKAVAWAGFGPGAIIGIWFLLISVLIGWIANLFI